MKCELMLNPDQIICPEIAPLIHKLYDMDSNPTTFVQDRNIPSKHNLPSVDISLLHILHFDIAMEHYLDVLLMKSQYDDVCEIHILSDSTCRKEMTKTL